MAKQGVTGVGQFLATRRYAFFFSPLLFEVAFFSVFAFSLGETGVGTMVDGGDPEDLHHGLLKRDAWRIWVGWAASWRELG